MVGARKKSLLQEVTATAGAACSRDMMKNLSTIALEKRSYGSCCAWDF